MRKRFLVLSAIIPALLSCGAGNLQEERNDDPDVRTGVVLKNIAVQSIYLDGDSGLVDVYLPGDWQTSGKKYPVLYLLHGMGGNNNDWTSNGVQEMTDSAVEAGQNVPFAIIMPKGYNAFYVNDLGLYDNGRKFRWEAYFRKELIPFVQSNYPVMTDGAHTAIAGLSMGGYGASYHAFNYPDDFCLCYEMSGAVEGIGNALTPSVKQIFKTNGYEDPATWTGLPEYFMDCGTEDPLCWTANVNTDAYLSEIGFPHEFRKYPGVHEWPYWTAAYKRMLPELARHFNK